MMSIPDPPPGDDRPTAGPGVPADRADYPDPDRMGWPYGDILRADLDYAAADRRKQAASVYADADAKAAAEIDRWDALGRRRAVLNDVARIIETGLRELVADRPAVVSDLLADVPAVRQLRADVDEIADAVVNLRAKRPGVRS